MAVYAITGKLGSGKGKASIDQIRRYLRAGKRVATNCDVFLEHLMPERDRSTITRIPDKPSAVDFYLIGSGNRFVEFEPLITHGRAGMEFRPPSPKLLPGFDESHNGALILDECASWLNTRNFQDKGRAELLEWAIHARKYGWDVYFVMQNVSQIDKQLRDSLFEYVVRLNRLDRMKLPVVSGLLKFITAGATEGSLPRVHIGVVRLGPSPDGLVADRWVFRGDDLNDAYNTTQVFSDTYPHGAHSLLSAWHLSAVAGVPPDFVGPSLPGPAGLQLIKERSRPLKPVSPHMSKFLAMAVFFGGLLGCLGTLYFHDSVVPAPLGVVAKKDRVYSDKIRIVGHLRAPNGKVFLSLSDGRSITAKMTIFNVDGTLEAEIEPGVWVKGNI